LPEARRDRFRTPDGLAAAARILYPRRTDPRCMDPRCMNPLTGLPRPPEEPIERFARPGSSLPGHASRLGLMRGMAARVPARPRVRR
jgi:hypothetical protein